MNWGYEGDRNLGQFSTPSEIAKLLVDQVSGNPELIIDLGVGPGALARAARNRFRRARIIGVDIDLPTKDARCDLTHNKIFLRRHDLVNPLSWQRVLRRYGQADLIFANPPYGKARPIDALRVALDRIGIRANGAEHLRLELVFLSAAFSMVRPGGWVGFVLPYSVMEYSAWGISTQWLLERAGLSKVIRLQQNTFRGTEVQAGLFLFRPGIVSASFEISQLIHDRLVRLPDIEKRIQATRQTPDTAAREMPSLRQLGVEVRRGEDSKAALQRSGKNFFHTTSFSEARNGKLYLAERKDRGEHLLAEEGDILIPRVGTRCLDREAIVVRGSRIVTDCILRLRPPENVRNALWRFIHSDRGRRWRLQLARGSCAQFIPQASLFERPIPL